MGQLRFHAVSTRIVCQGMEVREVDISLNPKPGDTE